MYFNGVAETSSNYTGGIFPGTDDLGIGANVGNLPIGSSAGVFFGLIDEPALYNRALSAQEIQNIYLAGAAGKCPVPPTIVAGSTNATVTANQTAVFGVVASGSQPLSYQWSVNNSNIIGATGPTLTLLNVQSAQAGTYYVTVSNAASSPVSNSATLTVLPAPPCDSIPSGIISWWAGENNALDNLGTNNGIPVNNPSYARRAARSARLLISTVQPGMWSVSPTRPACVLPTP